MSDFLIRLDESNFYTKTADGKLFGSPYPNCALHMDYATADRRCQEWRDDGYPAAMVVNRYGQPVSAADLEAMKSIEYQVLFSKHYFVGINASGDLEGSRDRSKAKNMLQDEAEVICRRLKKARHSDACLVEAPSKKE
jgi:hypothetical protein